MSISKGYKGIYDLYFTNSSSGKRTKISTGKKTRKEAERFWWDFKMSNGNDPKPKQPKKFFSHLVKEVLEFAQSNFMPKTYELYNLTSKKLIDILGDREIHLYFTKDFETYKNIRVLKVSKTTANIEIRTIKAMFNYAVRMGYLDVNPTEYVQQFSIPQNEKLSFSDVEVKKFLDFMDDNYFKDLIIFGLLTGCRLNEILNIQIRDIDFQEMILAIKNKPDFKIKTGKIRYIPISDYLNELLKSIISRSGNVIELSEPERYLFTNPKGLRLNGNYVSKKFKEFLRQAQLPEKYHFHCLRHTFITNLIKNGVNINYAKQLAGHSDIKTTMGYVHIETEDLREAVNKVKLVV